MIKLTPEFTSEQQNIAQAHEVIKHWQQKGMSFGRYVNDEICFLNVSSDGRCFPLDSDFAIREIAKCVAKGQNFHLD